MPTERVELAKVCLHRKIRYRKRGTEAVCLNCGFVQTLMSPGHRDVEVVKSWHLPEGSRMWDLSGSALVYYQQWHVDKETWEAARQAESPDVIHPCTSWDALQCDCAGSCGCHWKSDAPRPED